MPSRVRQLIPGSSAAFTLIELLVVVSIIAILATLLLPAISMVQGQARSRTCASNLRMINIATMTYTAENDGILPYHEEGTEHGWRRKTEDYLENLYVSDDFRSNAVYTCPHAVRDITNPWRYHHRFSFHYSINDAMHGIWRTTDNDWFGAPANPKKPVALSRVKSYRVLFADGNVNANGGLAYVLDAGGADPTSWQKGPWPVAGNTVLLEQAMAGNDARRIIRHRGTVNQAHLDGHISTVSSMWLKSDWQKDW